MLDQLKPQLDCPNCGEKNISGYPCRHCGYDPDMTFEPFWSPEIDQAYEDAYADDDEPENDVYSGCGMRPDGVCDYLGSGQCEWRCPLAEMFGR